MERSVEIPYMDVVRMEGQKLKVQMERAVLKLVSPVDMVAA